MFLKWAKPGLFSFILVLFTWPKDSTNLNLNDKSIVGVLGTPTRGYRMVGTDESTELWRHTHFFTKCLVFDTNQCNYGSLGSTAALHTTALIWFSVFIPLLQNISSTSLFYIVNFYLVHLVYFVHLVFLKFIPCIYIYSFPRISSLLLVHVVYS